MAVAVVNFGDPNSQRVRDRRRELAAAQQPAAADSSVPLSPTGNTQYSDAWLADNGLEPSDVGPAPPSVLNHDPLGDAVRSNVEGRAPMSALMRRAQLAGPQQSAARHAEMRLAEMPLPESGTLPGEEQVTTSDTLRALSPAERTALQRKFESGGHSGTMSYDDWLSENFGELPPTERVASMRSAGAATPRINIGATPLPPGENSELAQSRIAAGKPLPEGREDKQYTPEQRRTMSRNVHNPDIPMTRFGGTFTHTPGGALTSRAPNPVILEQANAIAADQGEYSDSHIAALAQAYGIDATRYGNDMDMLRADVKREEGRHKELLSKYDIEETGGGGFRYVPSDQFRDRIAMQDNNRFANTLRRRYQGLQGEANGQDADALLAAAEAAAGTPEGKEKMVQLNQLLRRIKEGNQMQSARNRAQNYNISQDLRNPNQAPGMAVRSLMEAVNTNNPLQMAAVYDIFGNPTAGAQLRGLSGTQSQAAADVAVAEEGTRAAQVAANAKQDDQDMVGKAAQEQFQNALALLDPEQRYAAVERIVMGMNSNATPEQVADRTQNIIASDIAKKNGVTDPFVQHRLQVLRASKNKDAFMRFAMEIGAASTPEEALWLFNNPEPPRSPEQLGEDLARNAREGVKKVAGFLPGVWRGLTRP